MTKKEDWGLDDDEDWMGDGKKESEDGGSSHQAGNDGYTVEDWSFDNPDTKRPMTSEERAEYDGQRESLVGMVDSTRRGLRRLLELGAISNAALLVAAQPYKRYVNRVHGWSEPKNVAPSDPYGGFSDLRAAYNGKEVMPKIAAVTGVGLGHATGATLVILDKFLFGLHKFFLARRTSTQDGKVVKEPFGNWMKRVARNFTLALAGTAAVAGIDTCRNSPATSDKPDAKPKSGSDVRGGSTIEDWLDSAGKKADELGNDVKNWAEKQMK